MSDGTFALDSSPAPIKGKRKFCGDNPAQRQTVLFAGLACLPGQNDLFPTDGRHERPGPWQSRALKTSLESRLAEAKAQCSGALILLRVGDFYEAFGADATSLAQTCGLTLSRQDSNPMAGFPYHHLDAYLGKLIASGKRVAVCEIDPETVAPLPPQIARSPSLVTGLEVARE